MNKVLTEKMEAIFSDWQIMRMNIFLTQQEFRKKYGHKYESEVKLNTAMRKYVHRKLKGEASKLMKLKQLRIARKF